jgi:hypothetical protein
MFAPIDAMLGNTSGVLSLLMVFTEIVRARFFSPFSGLKSVSLARRFEHLAAQTDMSGLFLKSPGRLFPLAKGLSASAALYR